MTFKLGFIGRTAISTERKKDIGSLGVHSKSYGSQAKCTCRGVKPGSILVRTVLVVRMRSPLEQVGEMLFCKDRISDLIDRKRNAAELMLQHGKGRSSAGCPALSHHPWAWSAKER